MKSSSIKRPRNELKEEDDEEDWEEISPEESVSSSVEADESSASQDEYSRLESGSESEESPVKGARCPRKLSSSSKQPPKKVVKSKGGSWWDMVKRNVDRIPLFSELQLYVPYYYLLPWHRLGCLPTRRTTLYLTHRYLQ